MNSCDAITQIKMIMMIRETKMIMMIEKIMMNKVTTAAGGAAASNAALASQLRRWEVAEEEILVKMIKSINQNNVTRGRYWHVEYAGGREHEFCLCYFLWFFQLWS